jgi:hypothetical protein
LRQLVFERLNTGGVKLSQQEVRNCLYQGDFNSMLFELATHPVFRAAWGLPQYGREEAINPPPELLRDRFYSKMTDVEVILRFFALRHAEHYQRGMQGFLDLYMVRSRRFTRDDLSHLRALFVQTLELASAIYGDLIFRPWDVKGSRWAQYPKRAFADAVMVGLSRNLDSAEVLRQRRQTVIDETRRLFESHARGTFTGRGNTKADVQERIFLFNEMLHLVAQR